MSQCPKRDESSQSRHDEARDYFRAVAGLSAITKSRCVKAEYAMIVEAKLRTSFMSVASKML
eukprot:CAMPEP_0181417014 /NCGR_PEP_ID=MMETSP1110-20121109/10822_1 /TAXON_ID=174948 /ORGANISM="Symbiodinium sp., Strain CCMP421" /LENGTH=61 /DNA_ID=CAMNT_0023539951 /DNA_START=42 /DNA_END=227 /DNA_ORIENTATION=+